MITRNKFIKLISKIDNQLNTDDVQIFQRPIQAFSEITTQIDKTQKVKFFLTSKESIDENDFSADSIYAQVNKWYENRYGNLIRKHLGPGNHILMIKGEAWKVRLPLCFGRNQFIIGDSISEQKKRIKIPDGSEIHRNNILTHIEHITDEIVRSLSDNEKEIILEEYMFGLNAIQSLRNIENQPYMEQAKNDYDVAVENIFSKFPNYNNSKWASLQFTEKTIKSKLKSNDIGFERNHDLITLSSRLSCLDITIPKNILKSIQCSAGVRYGEQNVKKIDALLAIRCSLDVYTRVFKDFQAFDINKS
ncbi:MAG: hypothetical protein L3J51_03185 [Cocleimonas sp.]|nr:hypothetical protein [Cocleimonas sp.]